MKKELKTKIANTIFKRFKGLMFKKNIKYAIYFPKCNAIHTFFVRVPIDIYVLDKNRRVLKSKKNIRRNKIVKVKYNINKVGILEIPTSLNFNCKVGDTIIFK